MAFVRPASIAACLALALPLVLNGQTVETQQEPTHLTAPQLFPEKTLIYLRIDDVRQLKEDLGRSTLGKLGNDNQLKPILSEFYGSLVNNTAQLQDAIGLNLDELLSIPTGEMAIALLPPDRGGNSSRREKNDDSDGVRGRAGNPAVAIVLDAGDEIASVQVMLSRMHDSEKNLVHQEKTIDRLTLHHYQNPDRRREQFAYLIDGGVIIGCSDADYLEYLAERWLGTAADRSSLADNRKFTSLLARCVGTAGERPQISYYADPLETIRQLAPKNAGTSMVLALIPALGIDGFEAIGGSVIVAPPDFDSISHFHISLSSPRRGLLGLLRPKSGSTTPEDWIPDTVAGYSTINWDLASTLQGVERLYNQFYGEEALDRNIFDRVNQRYDIDLRNDILENLEGRITTVQGFVRPAKINSGSGVFAIRMRNPEYVKNNVVPKIMAEVSKRFEVTTEGFGKLTAQVFNPFSRLQFAEFPVLQQMFPSEICVAFIDDYLVVSDSRYMMRQLADCAAGVGLRLKDSLEFQLISDRIAAQLQEKECSAISFERPEESLQLMYELARDPQNFEWLKGIGERRKSFGALLSDIEKNSLPPFSVIAKYLAPRGGFLVEEETGLHYMTFSLRREE